MDNLDKQILDIIQSDFPVASRPYAVLGDKLGVSEDEVLERVRAMRETGLIRRMGASFGSRQLGWTSTLCAAKVPEDQIEAFTAEVNRHSGVTHNYLRKHEFNIWFTMIAPDMETIEATLAEITANTGIEVLNLPADKLFKIKVDFSMNQENED